MNQVAVRNSTVREKSVNGSLDNRKVLLESALLFVAAWVVLFLLNSRVVAPFDEGLLLTDAMRTAAGQVVHRDFNYYYGPAQLYLLAGLFKLFGPSVLAERIANSFFAAGLVVALYVLSRRLCRRIPAILVVIVGTLWLIGLMMLESLMYPALCMLTLWTSWLILPITDARIQRRRALGAGFLAAIMFLFRYDTGMAIVAANLLAAVIMNWIEPLRVRRSLKWTAAKVIGPYLAAFLAVIIPAAITFLSVAPIRSFLDDVSYVTKYYPAGRGQPFPKLQLGPMFRENAVYLLPIILVLGFWLAALWVVARRKRAAEESTRPTPEWVNLILSLGIAAVMLSEKGFVRTGIGALCECVMACVLIAALLLEHRALLNIWLRGLLITTVTLLVVTGMSAVRIQLLYPIQWPFGFHLLPLTGNGIVTPDRQPPTAEWRSWCHDGTPVTRGGVCFLLDTDHIQTIRYLGARTRPGDYLYVGLPHHDRIIMGDNVLYFAVQRLPAIRWAQFAPFLENRADIQQEMIVSLEQHKPPYVVLDSEYDNVWEPNGSSVHTGVYLLDDYIAAHYKPVQQYGELTILQRQD